MQTRFSTIPVPSRLIDERSFHAYGSVSVEGACVLALGLNEQLVADGCGATLARHRLAGDAVTICDLSASPSNRQQYTKLSAALESSMPTRIYLPSTLEAPDVFRMVRTALDRLHHRCALWMYENDRPIRPNVLVDVDPIAGSHRSSFAGKSSRACHLATYRALCAETTVFQAEAFFAINHPEDCAWDIDHLNAYLLMGDAIDTFHATLPVSIIIRTRNRPRFLAEALESCRNQTVRPYEVVVVNDAGEDVAHVLDAFQNDLNIRYEHLTINVGRAEAANVGWRAANGSHVIFLDDDDVLLPEHVEVLCAASRTSSADIVYTGTEIRSIAKTPDGGEVILSSRPYLKPWDPDSIWFDNCLTFMSALVPKACLESVGGVDPSYRTYEDWDLWMRLSRLYRFQLVPHITSVYRLFQDEGLGATFYAPVEEALRQLYAQHHTDIPESTWEAWRYRCFQQPGLRAARELALTEAAIATHQDAYAQCCAREQTLTWRVITALRQRVHACLGRK